MAPVNLRARRAAGMVAATLAAVFLAVPPADAFDRSKAKSGKPLLLKRGFSLPEARREPVAPHPPWRRGRGLRPLESLGGRGPAELLRDSPGDWEVDGTLAATVPT